MALQSLTGTEARIGANGKGAEERTRKGLRSMEEGRSGLLDGSMSGEDERSRSEDGGDSKVDYSSASDDTDSSSASAMLRFEAGAEGEDETTDTDGASSVESYRLPFVATGQA